MALPVGILVADLPERVRAGRRSGTSSVWCSTSSNGVPAIVIGIFVFGLFVVGQRPERLRGRLRARDPHAAARRALDDGGARARAELAARGEPRARRPALADDAQHRPAAERSAASSPARCSRSPASPARPRRCSSRRRSSARRRAGTRTTRCRRCRWRSSSSPSRPTRRSRARLGGRASCCCSSSCSRASAHAGSRPAAAQDHRPVMEGDRSDDVDYDRADRDASRRRASRCRRASGSRRSSTSRASTRIYGGKAAIKGVTMEIYKNLVTAIIGPSGCGKSTFIRCFNRMNDLIPGVTQTGTIRYHGQDIYGAERRPGRGAAEHRHGLPAAEPVPEVDLRQRRLGLPRARHEGRTSTSASSARSRRPRSGTR